MPKAKKLISPENPEIEYFDLLASINANLLDDTRMAFIEYGLGPSIRNRKYLWIRHDVDWDLKKAVEMARVEAEYGYQSTYFLLHSAEYWKDPEFDRMVREISTLGHSLGVHNNAIVTWYKNKLGPKPFDIIKQAKDRIEQASGKPIIFTSSHGDRLCKEIGNNYDMWIESPCGRHFGVVCSPNEEMYELSSLDNARMLEAYFIRRDAYLTDSGHKWRGAIKKEIPTFEHFDKVVGAIDTVAKFNAMPEGVMQLLVHPCWWEVK